MNNNPIHPSRRASAFTIIELLVVMGIIVVLVGSVMVAGSALITKSKITNTRATLIVVRDAVEQFAREQKAKPTLTRRKQGGLKYKDRFGFFPPDELEWFDGIRGANIIPDVGTFDDMLFFVTTPTAPETASEHRDLAAMILAIELFGNESKDILNRIAGRNRTAGPVDGTDDPSQFLDRNTDGAWDADDVQIRYIVDDWGTPIGYMSQRDWVLNADAATRSQNHQDWNRVSTQLIRLNSNQPLIFSYGPDGRDQLTKDAMGTAADASIPTDFAQDPPAPPNKLDHAYNADNVYVDETLKEKL
ncbi:MAG: type II secretion system protein [Planctomycetes bacterium]|nr:type II secretion system protein [Planctomycetota bacterium]